MFAVFDDFDLKITKDQAIMGSHSGSCDDDINGLLSIPSIKRQFKKIDPESIRSQLRGYGAWDEEELKDDKRNQARILWIACGDIREEKGI